ncbi:hypothetical protein SS50377_20245 [Spironucleus salmonicida]|uniref:WKF domain-containing protein n=1 Tax=Spironucleus salmonicida TaxID=348837 RepID=V6LWW9_9EUKA|nr:hypothetical protein SS50377_20245 [Spironucleus salmonicida]|eukprot:EST45299.1 hypothetical protein SS50377_14876 [Spironucleus salmonicida]
MTEKIHYGVQYSKVTQNPQRLQPDQKSETSKKHISNIIEYLRNFDLYQKGEGSWKFSTILQAELLKSMFNIKLIDKDFFKITMNYFKTNKSRLVCQQVLNEIENQKVIQEKQGKPSKKVLKRLEKMFKIIDKNQREIMAQKGNLQIQSVKQDESSSD